MSTVYVGLSGGVDSAVSAALLKVQGHTVVGCFIKIWSPEFIECTWKEDRLDAMRVCAALDIPFTEIDLSEEYKKDVVGSMVSDYAKGITPNPDVLCNQHIKFGSFAKWALDNGAEKIATGHYAQMWDLRGRTSLHRAVDTAKDQSYFLYRIPSDVLTRTLFPIGAMHKADVRAAAKRFGLPNASKPDSQGLCFVGEVSMRDFLARFISVRNGNVVDEKGTVIGQHEGAALYTIGQRHGFTTSGASGPYYVTRIDTHGNVLLVSTVRENAARESVLCSNVTWINEPSTPLSAQIQCRYHEPAIQAEINMEGKNLRVKFEEAHIASPGQSLVVYNGDECLGGGVIL